MKRVFSPIVTNIKNMVDACSNLSNQDASNRRRRWSRFTKYAALWTLLLVIVSGCAQREVLQIGNPVNEKKSHESCEPAIVKRDLYQDLIESDPQQQRLEQLTKKLERLKSFVRAYVRKGRERPINDNPNWVADSFTAKGVQWDKFAGRFQDRSIEIKRWQTNPQAPSFEGDKAFGRFVDDSFGLWGKSTDFRLELKPYKTKWEENQLVTRIVAETFGQTSDETGQQATALWETRWKFDGERSAGSDDQSLTLVSIEIKAQEQISLTAQSGQLFHDCTKSVLAATTLMDDQLKYGLDQWARRMPGIDVVGEHGIAVGDVDNDGLDDLYICQAHGLPNLLLLQNPDGSVRDAAKEYGVDILDQSHGALIVDLDNDGDQDLAITTSASLVLMSQKGDGHFQLEHEEAIGHNGRSLSAVDYDQDGDLDLYICKHRSVKTVQDLLTIPESRQAAKTGGRNVLLRNDEGWNFVDVTEQSGFAFDENNRYSRSAVWTDYDLDGDQDLYIANEWSTDQLFQNESGWFSEVGARLKLAVPGQHRSVSTGDFNLDGKPDFFVATDAPLSASQRISKEISRAKETPAKTLAEREQAAVLGEDQIWFSKRIDDIDEADKNGFESFFLRAPIFSSESSFGSVAADINNDGLDDVIVTNGHLSRNSSDDVGGLFYANLFTGETRPATVDGVVGKRHIEDDILSLVRSGVSIFGRQRNRCYLSIGNLGFANFSSVAGLDFREDARAVATTDWDSDGDVDVITTARNSPQLRILVNQSDTKNGFLHFRLIGTESNRDAIGARVDLFLSGRKSPLVKFVTAGSGSLSQSSKRLFFGLGNGKTIEKAVVTWPNGKTQTFDKLLANTRYTITEGADKLAETNNTRFELVLKRSAIESTIALPPLSESRFHPETWLPNIEYIASNKLWYSVSPVNGAFTTVVFCDGTAESKKALESFYAATMDYSSKELDCVGVFIEREATDAERLGRAEQFFASVNFPFRWGAAAESSIQKLEFYAGEWFSYQQLPQLPFAVVMTPYGQIDSFHTLETSADIAELNRGIKELAENDAVRLANDRGRWLNRYQMADFSRLVEIFRKENLNRTADELFFRSRPHMAFQLSQYASELRSQGDLENARKFYDRAIELFPKNVPALIGQGELLRTEAAGRTADQMDLKIIDLTEAESCFAAALEVDPLSTEAIVGKTNVLIDGNETSRAIGELKAYLELDPERAEVHAILGRLYFSNRDFATAVTHLLAAYELRPTLPYVAGDLGYLYLSSGEIKLGRQFLRLSHRLQPSDRNVVKHLAEAEFSSANYSEAVSMLTKAAELHPNHRRTKQLLAWLLATSPFEEDRAGDQGQKLMKPLVMIMGDRSPTTQEIYAACLAEAGDFELAVTHQEKAVALVRSDKTMERYSKEQKSGMVERLELYRRQRPYRTADLQQIPIRTTIK